MQLKSFIAAAGLAATTAHAFLLPTEVSDFDKDIINTLPVPVKSEIEVHTATREKNVNLMCPGCPVRIHHWKHDEEPKIKTDIKSHLELDFFIDNESEVERLMLNNFELYPNADPFTNTLTAPLRPEFKHKLPTHHKGKPHRPQIATLGFGLRTQTVPTTEEDNLELIVIDLQIIEVGNAFVDGIPNVQVKLVKLPNGSLAIGNVEITASENIQKTPMDKQEECTTWLCKWRAVIAQQLARLRAHKGCGGRKGQVSSSPDGENAHRHGGHRGHGHHEHKVHQLLEGNNHSWGQLFKNIGSHILLPVAVGIMAGVGASILGMMVGTFIVYLWRKFFRPAGCKRHHRRHGHSAHKAAQHEVAIADEKRGLMADQDEPPAYVEEGVVVADKKSEDEA